MQHTQDAPKSPVYVESTSVVRRTGEATGYKSLALFYVAANALLFAGQLLDPDRNWGQFLLLQWCACTGVFMIYRFNDIVDHSENFRLNFARVLSKPLHVAFLVQFVCITVPALFVLSDLRITLLLSTCFLGLLYSVNLRVRNRNYRIKHLFLVKNLLIGTLWGSTIPIGANAVGGGLVMGLFVFASIQVTAGSIIRDVPDIDADRRDGVRTLPVVLGIPRTITAIHGLNLLSVAAGWLLFPDNGFLTLMLLVVAWRVVTVRWFALNLGDPFYSNTLNLLTCLLIFAILFMQRDGL